MASNTQQKNCYRFGRFQLDPAECRLWCNHQHIHLPPKEFDLLVAFVSEPEHLFTKDELLTKVCGSTSVQVEEGNISHYVSLLRKALSDSCSEHKYIETVPTKGYRFTVSVTRIARDDIAESRAKDTSSPLSADQADARVPPEPRIGEASPLTPPPAHHPSADTNIGSRGFLLSSQYKTGESPETARGPVEITPGESATPVADITDADEGRKEAGTRDASDASSLSEASTEESPAETAGEVPAETQKHFFKKNKERAEEATSQAQTDNTGPAEVDAPSIDPKVIIAIFVIVVSVMVLAKNYKGPIDLAKICASALQFFVVLCAFIYTESGPKSLDATIPQSEEEQISKDAGYYSEDEWIEAKGFATAALKEFTKYWYGLLVSWYVLYMALAFLWEYDPSDKHPILLLELILRNAANLFNNCNSLMLALGYMVLNTPKVIRKKDEPDTNDVPWRAVIVVVVFVVTLLEFFVSFLSHQDQSYLINRANVLEAFDWVSGIFGGVALALFVGRLQSRFLDPSSFRLIGLYLYIALQPLYALIGRDKGWAGAIMYFALILKGLLCFHMIQLFQSGDLLFYFVHVRQAYKKVPAQMQNFRKLLKW